MEEHHEHGHLSHHQMMAGDFRRRFWVVLVLSFPILALSPTIQGWFGFALPGFAFSDYVLFGLASIVAFYGGMPFYKGSLDEIKNKNYGMMTLVSLAVLAGYFFSAASTFVFEVVDFYWEIATLVLVLLFGHWMEMKAVIGTGGALQELAKLIPQKANIIREDKIVEVNTEEVNKGDKVLIKAGEKAPVDGVVIDGESTVNESMITGESKPVTKSNGDKVIGGTINYDGALTIEVNKTGKETALSQIMKLISEAQSSRPKTQRVADKAANYLTFAAIGGGLLTFLFWQFVSPQGAVFALTLAITVVVIACPHALGLAIPTVTTITSTLAAKNGILVKDMTAMETAQGIDYIVFDKTGTLTKGEFEVNGLAVVGGASEEDVLQYGASVDVNSLHPIARAIVEEGKNRNVKFLRVENFRNVSGRGSRGIVDNKRVVVGSKSFMQAEDINTDALEAKALEFEERGSGVVWVGVDDKILGVLAVSDSIRDGAKEMLDGLKTLGILPVMLTGDQDVVAREVAEKLGIKKFFSEVLPEDKVNKIKELQSGDKKVAMVGDGINDAPSLTQANVGIAIGAGTDVAIESAEIILVKNDLRDVLKLLRLSRKTMAKMKQNLVWAAGYNIFAIPLAAGVLFPIGIVLRPEWGALLMSASSIIVVINALALRRAI